MEGGVSERDKSSINRGVLQKDRKRVQRKLLHAARPNREMER